MFPPLLLNSTCAMPRAKKRKQQKISILKKTTGLCSSRRYYSIWCTGTTRLQLEWDEEESYLLAKAFGIISTKASSKIWQKIFAKIFVVAIIRNYLAQKGFSKKPFFFVPNIPRLFRLKGALSVSGTLKPKIDLLDGLRRIYRSSK